MTLERRGAKMNEHLTAEACVCVFVCQSVSRIRKWLRALTKTPVCVYVCVRTGVSCGGRPTRTHSRLYEDVNVLFPIHQRHNVAGAKDETVTECDVFFFIF